MHPKPILWLNVLTKITQWRRALRTRYLYTTAGLNCDQYGRLGPPWERRRLQEASWEGLTASPHSLEGHHLPDLPNLMLFWP